eukprot:m.90974 g.90974  ORF g.90974 m.90974 type:complete len:557 (-) comp15286_c0_seq1:744-2414(-)
MAVLRLLRWAIGLGLAAFVCHTYYRMFVPATCSETSDRACIQPTLAADTVVDVRVLGVYKNNYFTICKWANVSLHNSLETTEEIELPPHMPANAAADVAVELRSTNDGLTFRQNSHLVRQLVPLHGRTVMLLTGEEKTAHHADRPVMHARSQLTILFADDFSGFPVHNLPTGIQLHFRNAGKTHTYDPLFLVDDFNIVRAAWKPVNMTTRRFNITVKFRPTYVGALVFASNMINSMQIMQSFGLSEEELDDVRAMMQTDKLTQLILTYVIVVLHLVFDYLAFKNDIKFWKGRKDLAGLSKRSVVVQAFFSLIIFLYLMDSENTSWFVRASSGVSFLIELWKVPKVLSFRRGLLGLPIPSWGHSKNVQETHTETFDAIAMRRLLWVAYPLVAGWAIYRLWYSPHRTWYSWFISSMANGIYLFGFVFMTPQLFINYKLKSVAHLPWRVMMYKTFNTFVDDVFAWVVHMPLAHRLACLRDDVIFFIYVYQRWLYPVDKTRVNEYGYSYESLQEGGDSIAASAETPDTTVTTASKDDSSSSNVSSDNVLHGEEGRKEKTE